MGILDVINKNEADLKDVTKPATNARVCKHTRESCIGTLEWYHLSRVVKLTKSMII